MELLIAILLAMKIFIAPDLSIDQIKEKYPTEYTKAQAIEDQKLYKVDDKTGLIIIDDGVGD